MITMQRSLIVFGIIGSIISFYHISGYILQRKDDAERERKLKAYNESKAKIEMEERKRKSLLKKHDSDVDKIIYKILIAKQYLQIIIKNMNDFEVMPHDKKAFQHWKQDNEGLMDFFDFEEIVKYFKEYSEDNLWYSKSGLEKLLEDNFEPESCIMYADDKLGLSRNEQLVDGPKYGGTEVENANGRFEHVNKRVERVMKKLPGTDRGYVYVLTNPSFYGLVKIGKTHRNPEERVRELSKLSGVPTPFEVSYSIIVGNCGLVEKIIHNKLSDHRVANNREFFKISVSEVAELINQIIRKL